VHILVRFPRAFIVKQFGEAGVAVSQRHTARKLVFNAAAHYDSSDAQLQANTLLVRLQGRLRSEELFLRLRIRSAPTVVVSPVVSRTRDDGSGVVCTLITLELHVPGLLFADSTMGPGKGGPAKPILRLSCAKKRSGLSAEKILAFGLDGINDGPIATKFHASIVPDGPVPTNKLRSTALDSVRVMPSVVRLNDSGVMTVEEGRLEPRGAATVNEPET
jgi:hypothetical protein